MFFSLVIPAYNEAHRIGPTLERVADWARTSAVPSFELIVVDDGSTDGTAALVRRWEDRIPALTVIEMPRNVGKGRAVTTGMLRARGQWRAFIDADGSTDPSELTRLIGAETPVAIGSVAVAGSTVSLPQPALRVVLGQLGNWLIQRLILPGIGDTQRGCKLFRGDVAQQVFGDCETDGWAFDVEILARARALGFEPLEVPIRWEDRPLGSVKPWHYASTLLDVLRLRRLVGHQQKPRSPGSLSVQQVADW